MRCYQHMLAGLVAMLAITGATPTGLLSERNPLLSSNHHELARRLSGSSDSSIATSTCNLDSAKMPQAPTPLPTPSSGLKLTHVAIGRGTQNYTCANSTAQAIPAPAGAVASLFNATCIAGQYPQLLAVLPGIALRFPVPTRQTDGLVASQLLSGHHYFTNATTPFFKLVTDSHNWGSVATQKSNAQPAPNPSADVPWLKLTTTTADGCTIDEVYRVNTAGGVPPANCQGQPSSILVAYSAEYWMFSKTPAPPTY